MRMKLHTAWRGLPIPAAAAGGHGMRSDNGHGVSLPRVHPQHCAQQVNHAVTGESQEKPLQCW